MAPSPFGLHATEPAKILFWRILLQIIQHALMRKSGRWNELDERQSVEANHIPDKLLAATGAKVSQIIYQLILRHAPIADNLESFFI